MTPAERRALAAALRHGREHKHYEFRAYWWSGRRNYRWYRKPFTGWDAPVLTATDMGAGQWLLESEGAGFTTNSVRHALAALEFFGVYQPEMAEVA